MVGQKVLLETIDRLFQEKKFPRTLLLEGEYGCGKHTIANMISNKLGISLIDISDKLTLETIEQIMLSPLPFVYLIDSSDMTIKEQNIILKFLEEPLKNAYIVLLCESKQRLLPTVLNRCYCLTFESYSIDELRTFLETDNQLVLKYATTPGRVIQLQNLDLDSMVDLSNKIFLKITLANYSNVLTIPDKLCFSKEPDGKLDFKTFSYILINIASELYSQNQLCFNAYKLTDEFYNNLSISNINKKQLFEHFLVELKMLMERE